MIEKIILIDNEKLKLIIDQNDFNCKIILIGDKDLLDPKIYK